MMTLSHLLMIASGGALGAVLRVLGTQAVNRMLALVTMTAWPYGTFIVNIIGALCLGALWQYNQTQPLSWQPFLASGLMGAFTTFSTFSVEALQLLQAGRVVAALFYLLASVVVGVLAAYFGAKLV